MTPVHRRHYCVGHKRFFEGPRSVVATPAPPDYRAGDHFEAVDLGLRLKSMVKPRHKTILQFRIVRARAQTHRLPMIDKPGTIILTSDVPAEAITRDMREHGLQPDEAEMVGDRCRLGRVEVVTRFPVDLDF